MERRKVDHRHRRQTILVVDDDEEWSELAAATLAPHYRTRLAANSGDALRLARLESPALIVLDVMMSGGMDGFSTLCELRKDEATRSIPVIMCTEVNAVADTEFTSEGLERYLGTAPSAFLEKPVTPARLLAEVASVLGQPEA